VSFADEVRRVFEEIDSCEVEVSPLEVDRFLHAEPRPGQGADERPVAASCLEQRG
jgi:hypothetical protein